MANYKIGRGADNDIAIDEPSISRVHAELSELPDGRFRLRDLGSSNGTMVQLDGGWEKIEEATVDGDTPLRLGQRFATAAELIEIQAGPAADAPARDDRYNTPTDQTAPGTAAPHPLPGPGAPPARASTVSSTPMPRWVIPAAAIGGGAVLIIIVAVVLILGPFGGPSSKDFVEACSSKLGSRAKCQCWADALEGRFTDQDFSALTRAIRKRDWTTALPPLLREKFVEVRPRIEASCGKLG